MANLSDLEHLARTYYDAPDASVRLLASGWDGSVYLLTQPHHPPWALRVLDRGAAESDVPILPFLERHRFPQFEKY